MGRATSILERRGSTVKVPKFKTRKEVEKFLQTLGLDDTPAGMVVDPESGEIIADKGYTRRKDLQTDAKGYAALYRHGESPVLFTSSVGDFTADFDLVYNIVKKPIGKQMDSPGKLMDLDYDVSIEVPVLVSRKDGFKFGDADKDNMASLVDIYNKKILPSNLKLRAGKVGPKRAQFSVELH